MHDAYIGIWSYFFCNNGNVSGNNSNNYEQTKSEWKLFKRFTEKQKNRTFLPV